LLVGFEYANGVTVGALVDGWHAWIFAMIVWIVFAGFVKDPLEERKKKHCHQMLVEKSLIESY
jgi:hypothetical protein